MMTSVNPSHRWVWLLFFLTVFLPHELFALPRAIKQVVQIFDQQGKSPHLKKQPNKPSKQIQHPPRDQEDNSTSLNEEPLPAPSTDSVEDRLLYVRASQAKIREVCCHPILGKHPASWYYKGVIDHWLLKYYPENQAKDLLQSAITSYKKVQDIAHSTHPFYKFSVANLSALWAYYVDKGDRYYKQGGFQQALDCFAIALDILPDAPDILLRLAMGYHASHELDQALHYYQKYELKIGRQANICRVMAEIDYMRTKDVQQSVIRLNQFLTHSPFESSLLDARFSIYQSANQLEEYEKILLAEDSVNGWYGYAHFLQKQSRNREADVYYHKILKQQPKQLYALRGVGLLWYNQAVEMAVSLKEMIDEKNNQKTSLFASLFKRPYLFRIKPQGLFISEWTFLDEGRLMMLNKDHCFYSARQMEPGLRIDGGGWYSFLAFHAAFSHQRDHFYCYNSNFFQQIVELVHRAKMRSCMSRLDRTVRVAYRYLHEANRQDQHHVETVKGFYFVCFYLKKYRSARFLYQRVVRNKQYIDIYNHPFILK